MNERRDCCQDPFASREPADHWTPSVYIRYEVIAIANYVSGKFIIVLTDREERERVR